MSDHNPRKSLHSTLKHQLRVSHLHRISRKDMDKLDDFRISLFHLGEVHQQLWYKYGFRDVSNYRDIEKLRKYGPDAVDKVLELYQNWLDLREEMEQFLERKNLPTEYPERVWTNYIIGDEGGWRNYDGSWDIHRFDSGPALWCSRTYVGMTMEMHDRLHLQRIELYSIAGFIVGLIGLIVGFVGLSM